MADRAANAQTLKDAVQEYGDKEVTRLEDQAAFLRSIQGSEQKISSQTTAASTALAFNDVNEFLKT